MGKNGGFRPPLRPQKLGKKWFSRSQINRCCTFKNCKRCVLFHQNNVQPSLAIDDLCHGRYFRNTQKVRKMKKMKKMKMAWGPKNLRNGRQSDTI
jgi:hypothetical protein